MICICGVSLPRRGTKKFNKLANYQNKPIHHGCIEKQKEFDVIKHKIQKAAGIKSEPFTIEIWG